MEKIYKRTSGIQPGMVSGFCPGCMHSTVNKLVGEVLEELGVMEKATVVLGVGCAGLANQYLTYNVVQSAHGRACAVATGIKRCDPDQFVFTYQGDGDLGAIALAETMSAANRGENFAIIFINNGIYGMTGGQMAPTTLVAPVYLERVSCNTPQNVLKTKKAIRKAFQNQIDGNGFSMVEIVTSCPTNWGMTPLAALDFIENNMLKEFPLGVIRDREV